MPHRPAPARHETPGFRAILLSGGLSLGLLWFGASCAAAGPPFEHLTPGTQASGFDRLLWQPTVLLATSPGEFESILRRAGRRLPPPLVDFRNHSVLVYFAGMKDSGGFRALADGVHIERGTMVLEVVDQQPGPGCLTPQTATFPMAIVVTTPWRGPVSFEERIELRPPCEL